MRRLLITGSRSWTDETTIRRELLARYRPGAVLVSGACPKGADAMCERAWRQLGGQVERHPADWQRYGRRAGMVRNEAMAVLGADECLAFIRDRSPGSTAMAAMAERLGIRVTRHEQASAAAAVAAEPCLFDPAEGAGR
jgi:hypothetical protein